MKKNSLWDLKPQNNKKTNYSIVIVYLMDQKLGINLFLSVETSPKQIYQNIGHGNSCPTDNDEKDRIVIDRDRRRPKDIRQMHKTSNSL
jgi:hypothetical protein